MIEKEIQKDIAGYEGKYKVINLGRVKSLNYRRTGKARILIPGKSNSGYLYVILSKKGYIKKFLIHRLAAQAFIENPKSLPEVNHIDENKSNNCVENLEWCDRKYNNNYGTHNEKILKTKKLRNCEIAARIISQFTKYGKFVKEYPSIHAATRSTGINQ